MGGGGWVSRGLVRVGHGKGDIVIAMLYGTISRQDLVAMTKYLAMKIAFPFEKAADI